jgi:hypothetical protein
MENVGVTVKVQCNNFISKTVELTTTKKKEPKNKPTTNRKITLNIICKKYWLFDINENIGVTVKVKCNNFITKPVELSKGYKNSVDNLKCNKTSKCNKFLLVFYF